MGMCVCVCNTAQCTHDWHLGAISSKLERHLDQHGSQQKNPTMTVRQTRKTPKNLKMNKLNTKFVMQNQIFLYFSKWLCDGVPEMTLLERRLNPVNPLMQVKYILRKRVVSTNLPRHLNSSIVEQDKTLKRPPCDPDLLASVARRKTTEQMPASFAKIFIYFRYTFLFWVFNIFFLLSVSPAGIFCFISSGGSSFPPVEIRRKRQNLQSAKPAPDHARSRVRSRK